MSKNDISVIDYLGHAGPRVELAAFDAKRTPTCWLDYDPEFSTWHGETEQFFDHPLWPDKGGSMTQNILAIGSAQLFQPPAGVFAGTNPQVLLDARESRFLKPGTAEDIENYTNCAWAPLIMTKPRLTLDSVVDVVWHGPTAPPEGVKGKAFSRCIWRAPRLADGSVPALQLNQQWWSAQSDTNPIGYKVLGGSVAEILAYIQSTPPDFDRDLTYTLGKGLTYAWDNIAQGEFGRTN